MKFIIRWLADLFGVTEDIRYEQNQDIAMRLLDGHYWLTGGVTIRGHSIEAADTLRIIAEQLKAYNHFDIEKVRKEVFGLIAERKRNSIYLLTGYDTWDHEGFVAGVYTDKQAAINDAKEHLYSVVEVPYESINKRLINLLWPRGCKNEVVVIQVK